MNMALKLLGMLLVFSSCFMLGAYKASRLKIRVTGLCGLLEGLSELSARLMYEQSERSVLIHRTLSAKGIEFDGKGLKCKNGLNAEDERLLLEFLSDFGSGDINRERERIELYIELFSKVNDAARREADQCSRLYKTLGACLGAAGCLIII